ncbi:MAG: fumarylacetoacetate hydrolase family protein, partial [Phycisphaerales bacterium]|nr:fumarylacetoacetate hydrolase family protein [Phycisphaerales bacterium]
MASTLRRYSVSRSGHQCVINTPCGAVGVCQIFGIGLNYAAHAREQGSPLPERPVVFAKNVGSAVPGGEAIVIPAICQDREQVDFEGELAIVIGTPARDVPTERALEFVLGYAAANDVSARWWQKQGSGGQFCRGKGFDTFCPLGDVTPAAQVANPNALRLVTRVNGTVMQDSSTSDMIFSCATLVSELSRGCTLLPGTVILTGTPSGVGMARNPQVFLQHGDVVEVEIEGVGVVRNPVVREGAAE